MIFFFFWFFPPSNIRKYKNHLRLVGHTKRGKDLARGLCLPSSEVELLFSHTAVFPIWLSVAELRYAILGYRTVPGKESDMTERLTQEGGTLQILVEWIPVQEYGVIMHVYVLSHFSCVWPFMTLWTIACQLLCPWGFPGKNTAMGCHALLQGIFLTQG